MAITNCINKKFSTPIQSPSNKKATKIFNDDLAISAVAQKAIPSPKSKETGDQPSLHDDLFNSIPGSCFEIGTSISLLEQPGDASVAVEEAAQALAQSIQSVFSQDGNGPLLKMGKGSKTLKEIYRQFLIDNCKPGKDIGRCRDFDLQASWDQVGPDWVVFQLIRSSRSLENPLANMLTKIRILCAFGEMIKALMSEEENIPFLASHFEKNAQTLRKRIGDVSEKIKHPEFDSPQARARTERMPVVENRSLGGLTPPISPRDGKVHQVGSGEIYVGSPIGDGKNMKASSFEPVHEEWRIKYLELEKTHGRNGLPRQGQPIKDSKRPGLLTEYSNAHMPESFKEAGLPELLKKNEWDHGSGINRWFIKGTYAKESWNADLPAAGSHSNTTVEALTAINFLSRKSIFGNRDAALGAGLMISAFMNFGGYHSFVETFLIAQAAAEKRKFEVKVRKTQGRRLYREMMEATRTLTPPATVEKANRYKEAYDRAEEPQSPVSTAVQQAAASSVEKQPQKSLFNRIADYFFSATM